MIPTVLVLGLLFSSEVFGEQIGVLWPFGPVVVANTLGWESIPELASGILAAAPSQFAICGISMGGYIALEVMRQAPERVVKLALLDTSARPDSPEQTAGRRALLTRARGSADFVSFSVEALEQIMIPKHRGVESIREINRRMVASVGLEGFARQTEAVITRNDPGPSSLPFPFRPWFSLATATPSLRPICRERSQALSREQGW